MMANSRLVYFGGARYRAGTRLPGNVTGECGHHHRTPELAQRCIDRHDAAIKRGHGLNAYSDRVVMVRTLVGGRVVSGSTHPLSDDQ